MNQPTKLIPHNLEAEQAVLGGLLIDPESLRKITPVLASSDFYLEKHAWIFEAMGALYAKHDPIDFLTLCAELERGKRLDNCGGAAYLTALINSTPSAYNIEAHAQEVARHSVARQLIRAAGEIAGVGFEPSLTTDEQIAKAHVALSSVKARRKTSFRSAYDVGVGMEAQLLEGLENPKRVWGLPTGLKSLDYLLGGLADTNLIVVGGAPGAGKSALGLQIAGNIAATGKAVAYFSLEMSAEEHRLRIACQRYGYNYQQVRGGFKPIDLGRVRKWTDEEIGKFLRDWHDGDLLPIYFNDASSITTQAACASAAELAESQNVAAIIFDYLQLAESGDRRTDANRAAQVDAVARGLKNMAKDLRLPVVALAQLNRASMTASDKRPTLTSFKESGGIEANADVALGIYRAKLYYKTKEEWGRAFPRDPYPDHEAEIIALKGRNGPLDFIKYVFDEEHTRFVELAKE